MTNKSRLLRTLSPALLFSTAAFVHAASQIEEVVVTGSYIKGSPEDAASPIEVISREDIDIQSAVTVDDITKNLTINSGTTTNTNFDTENDTITGKANVNLRGLGLNSTLVLFNGKRQVVAAAETQDGSEFVDINTIPMAMLERVEILKDGGSAIYGSDAIAGVVNFILRDDFEGLQIAADVTNTDRAGANDMTGSAVWGIAFNGGQSNFVIGGEYFTRDPYSFLDLGLTNASDRVTGAVNSLSVIIPGFIPGFSNLNLAYVNLPITGLTGQTRFTDPLCTQQGYFTGLFSDPANDPNQHCREDTRAYRGVQIEQDRYSLMASFKHELNDRAEFYALGQYYEQDILRPNSGAFGAIDAFQTFLPVGDPIFGLGSRAPAVVAARNAAFGAALAGGADPLTALVTAGFTAQAVMPKPANAPILAANGGPNAFTSMGYQVSKRGVYDLNAPTENSSAETSGLSLGIRGDFSMADRDIGFDVSLSYTQTSTYRENLTVNRTNLELAQNGLGGPNCVPNGVDNYNLNADANDLLGAAFTQSPVGVFGGILSYVTSNPAPGYVLNMKRNISLALTSTNQGVGDCMFINPFLTKETTLPNDPDLLRWIYMVVPLEDRENELLVFDAIFTAPLFDLGGGTAESAFGYQRRDGNNLGRAYPAVVPGLTDFLTYGANPTFLDVSDDHFYGQFTKQFSNDRDVNAVFAELQLPFTDDFEVQLAIRYEDYGGSIGAKTTPKIAARWQPTGSVTLRSSFSQAFRAPNTGVMFKGVGFDGATVSDPLAKADVRAGILPADNCLDTSNTTCEVVGIIQNGAPSPNVGNEEADTFNVGAIFTPASVDGLTLSIDYYWFDFTDKVVNQPPSATLANELANFQAAAANPANYIDQNTFLPCVQGVNNDCVVSPSAYLTPGVQRSAQGALQVVDFFNVNAGKIETSGLDIIANWEIDTGYGEWNLGLNWNHILEFRPSGIPGFENGIFDLGIFDAAGTSGDGSIARSMPANKANVTLNFRRSNHSMTGIIRHIAAYDNLGAKAFNSGTNPPKTVMNETIESHTVLDLQYNYAFDWGNDNPLSITVGAINAFDEDPPKRDDYAQGYDSTTVDPRGRRFYMRLVQSF